MNKTKKIISIVIASIFLCFLILFLPSFATNETNNNADTMTNGILQFSIADGKGTIELKAEGYETTIIGQDLQSKQQTYKENTVVHATIKASDGYSLSDIAILDKNNNVIKTISTFEDKFEYQTDITITKDTQIWNVTFHNENTNELTNESTTVTKNDSATTDINEKTQDVEFNVVGNGSISLTDNKETTYEVNDGETKTLSVPINTYVRMIATANDNSKINVIITDDNGQVLNTRTDTANIADNKSMVDVTVIDGIKQHVTIKFGTMTQSKTRMARVARAVSARGSQSQPEVGDVFSGTCQVALINNLPQNTNHTVHKVTMNNFSGILFGSTIDGSCYDHTAAAPLIGQVFNYKYTIKSVNKETGNVSGYLFCSSVTGSADGVTMKDGKLAGYQRVASTVNIKRTYNGTLYIQKYSNNTGITNNNGNYSLEGAKYTIYKDAGCTNPYTTVTTNANGSASYSLPQATYYVKETTAPKGYQLDTTIHTVSVGSTGNVNSYENPKTANIELTKTSGNTKISDNNSNYTLKDAEYTIYTDSACTKVVKVLTTDENGKASITGLALNKYYVKETKASVGYNLDETVYPLDLTSSTNATITGNVSTSEPTKTAEIKLKKESGNSNLTKDNNNYTLSGAEYSIYKDKNCTQVLNVLVTDENGEAKIDGLPLNTYWVMETKASKGYELDKNIYELDLNSTTDKMISKTISSIETPKFAEINLIKTSAKPEYTDDNSAYSLKGAEYTVYLDADCTKEFKTLITDKDGKAKLSDLPLNKYWIKETKASEGYQLDNTVYDVDLSVSTDSSISTTIHSKEQPFLYENKLNLVLGKKDSETNKNKPQGAASLEGAEYTIKFYAGIYETNPAEIKLPIKTWVLKTDKNGQIKYSNEYKVSGDTLFEDNIFPLGTMTIQETKAPKGYLINNEVIVKQLNVNGKNNDIETYNIPIGEEQIIKGDFLFRKVAYDEDNKNQPYTPLQGAKFTVTSKTTGKVVKTLTSDKYGTVTSATDLNSDDGSLPFDTYIITEIEAPKGHEKADPFEITIGKDGVIETGMIIEDRVIASPLTILKVDETTGETIKVANTKFKLLDSDKNPISMKESIDSKKKISEFVTDENGQISLAERLKYGTYYLEEVEAPNGYLKGNLLEFKVTEYSTFEHPLVVKYEDKNAMGNVTVNKVDSDTKKPIEGVTYTIKAAEDIITKDGTLRASKGEIVDVIKTNNTGSVTSKNLYLGKYTIQESHQHDGYIRDLKSYDFELKYKDQNTELVSKTFNFKNTGTVIGIDKFDSISTNKLSGVKFKIWNKADGEEESDIYTTDKNGNIEIKYIRVGTYCVKEVQSIPGYAVSDKIYEFTVSADGRINGKDSDIIKIPNTHIKLIGTTAINSDTKNHLALGTNTTIIDTVKMTGLQVGKEYKLKAIPMDVKTGNPITIDGKQIVVEKTFVAEKENQNVDVEITFNTASLKGNTINMFEELYDEGVLIAEHKDLTDQEQNIEIKDVKIGTSAIATDTKTKFTKFGEKTTIVDTVKYENIIPNIQYTMKGILMDKTTNNPVLINGKEVVSETTFTPTKETGTIDVTFTFNSNDLKGKDTVVFESLLYKNDEITSHKDIEDKDQTITFPDIEIKTKAVNKDTNTQFAQVGDKLTFVDTVSYKGLVPNYEYTMKGTLMDKETCKVLEVNGKAITAEAKFTPKTADGTVDVTFTVDTTTLEGKDIVVFEKLYYGDVEFAKHEDINDKDQTINVPKIEIKTKAINKDTNTQFAQVGDKLTFVDTVSYKGLVPNYEYTMKGTLMDKETGKVLEVNSKAVTAEAKFTPKTADGTVDVTFTVDTTTLEGKNIVVFEKLYYGDVEFAKHEDINDKDQTINVPDIEIKTKVINKDTNTQFAQVGDKLTFVDTVSYKGLVPNYEYTMKGTLMDKETGKPIMVTAKSTESKKDVSDEDKKDDITSDDTELKQIPLTAEAKFTPKTTDGTVDVTFTVNTTTLEGKDIVVFEKLYYGDVEFAKHEDINDKDQTINVPDIEIKTKAVNKDTNTQFAQVGDKLTFVDTVSYKGLVPNYEYTMKGTLMDKETSKVLEVNGKAVTAEAKFTPKTTDGTVDVTFTVDTTTLEGKDIVVFEKLYYGDVEFAKHEDINDKDQTINVPKIEIKTKVVNKDTNNQTADPKSKTTFIDTVSYKGLVPNYEYTMKGTLMDKETGKALELNGKVVTAEAKFTPKTTDGTVDVTFTVDTSNLNGKHLVVFEKLYYGNVEFAKHEDINDKDQTITMNVPKELPKKTQTGDNNKNIMIPLSLVTILGLGYVGLYIRKRKCNK